MASSDAATLAAEIRTLYARRLADKLLMQKNMAALRDVHGWPPQKIAAETGVPVSTTYRWLKAWDERFSYENPGTLTPKSEREQSDQKVAKRVIENASPEELIELIPTQTYEQIQERRKSEFVPPTPAQLKGRRAELDEMLSPVRKALAVLGGADIPSLFEEAVDALRELIGKEALTLELLAEIIDAQKLFEQEMRVARAFLGLPPDVVEP